MPELSYLKAGVIALLPIYYIISEGRVFPVWSFVAIDADQLQIRHFSEEISTLPLLFRSVCIPFHGTVAHGQSVYPMKKECVTRTFVHSLFRLHRKMEIADGYITESLVETFHTQAALAVGYYIADYYVAYTSGRPVRLTSFLDCEPQRVSVSPPESGLAPCADNNIGEYHTTDISSIANYYVQPPVGIVDNAVCHHDILEIAVSLCSYLERCRRGCENTVVYSDISYRLGYSVVHGRFQTESIVASTDNAITYRDVGAAVYVKTVGIHSVVAVGLYVYAVYLHPVAALDMDGPEGRFYHSDAFNPDILAIHHAEGSHVWRDFTELGAIVGPVSLGILYLAACY